MKIANHGFSKARAQQFFDRLCDDIQSREPVPDLKLQRTFNSGLKFNNVAFETLSVLEGEFQFHVAIFDLNNHSDGLKVLMIGTKDGAVAFHTEYETAPNLVNMISFDVVQWFLERCGAFQNKTQVEALLAPVYPDLPDSYKLKLTLDEAANAEDNKIIRG